ncbi:Uncharacterised protein [Mycoplasmopsis gallopavonis]|uniref:Uncharacterized protein n=1 Tax=Mycoplasmopsis gallopavonis TaxID=76629 RepID=A0A449AZH1_9BACT|nr:ECF transporter S component [Mycoplasmopsis gallopavonis]VEU72884.1 Uncharacterised protein [Mycoplasmopsis gallopavonis]
MKIFIKKSDYLKKYFVTQTWQRFFLALFFLLLFVLFLGLTIWIFNQTNFKTLSNEISSLQELKKTSTNSKEILKLTKLITEKNSEWQTSLILSIIFILSATISLSLLLWTRIYDFLYFKNNLNDQKLINDGFNSKIIIFFTFSSVFALIYKIKLMIPNLSVSLEDKISEEKLYNWNHHFQLNKNSKLNEFYKKHIKITINDIALSGILLALFVILTLLTKYTFLRFLSINFEYVFAIVYAFLFRYIKGIVLAFISDALSLIISGKIAFWYWGYAIVPLIIVLISAFAFDFYKRNKIMTVVWSNLLMILAFATLIFIFYYRLSTLQGDATEFKISKIFEIKKLPVVVGIALVFIYWLIALSLVILSAYYIAKVKSKNANKLKLDKIANFIFIFALIFVVIVISRWLWGPYVWIKYSLYIGKLRSKSYLTDLDWYFGLMIPIVLKSFIAIPVYVTLLVALLPAMQFLKRRYFDQNLFAKY